ncbi:MAG: bacteriohemerythrin [candidate division Zixibacteria bacterium]|nr:bacteriohemerythrin [candidate division Zixibacteria bacterium]MBU1470975.1 bacteriohemerythrin [candidate division Zixibacteria bacterium]MBU2625555.1 bacteriohemerythrin [candidate division Zixibacteria bacterium]
MNTRTFVKWHDRYGVGNLDLDNDHKAIISIINDLYTAIQMKTDRSEIRRILDRLLEYILSHFEREERLMEEARFPESERHRHLHRCLARKTQELRDRSLQNEEGISQEAMSFLKDWWIDHIIVMDMRYKPYIEGTKVPGRA